MHLLVYAFIFKFCKKIDSNFVGWEGSGACQVFLISYWFLPYIFLAYKQSGCVEFVWNIQERKRNLQLQINLNSKEKNGNHSYTTLWKQITHKL
jgi:hypothetical protein